MIAAMNPAHDTTGEEEPRPMGTDDVFARHIAIREATTADAEAIARIYNQGIAGRMATFETTLRTTDDIVRTLDSSRGRYPVLVATIGDEVAGWASVSTYRPRECYAGIGEFSIYIDERWRGRGVGRVLLPALIDAAERAGFWKLLSRVFPFNTGSRRLCAACGFREVGAYEKHAQLDGEWLDVIIVERLIPANQPE
ncbi:MAG TPA: arsinothricin resistance N-acetyltransferase ArsN1 [Thermomicrobiales bacterium]|nr:arsinothricin resistance N-acetyltransferase ArsN1 [Thermomicrobiales bacterium]